jgi:hypothetical protein
MEQLPYIDEHSIVVAATRERVWEALAWSLRSDLGRTVPGRLGRAMRIAPSDMRGDWRGRVSIGDALPGFRVVAAEGLERLELRGEHRFSKYALAFEIEETGPESCTVRAQTWAAFPGLRGRAYRALVIDSGAHRVVVGRMLRRIAKRTR